VVIEAESSKVGERALPPALWSAMTVAPRIVLDAPAQARAAYLAQAYADLTSDPARLEAALARLPDRVGRARRAAWAALAREGAHLELAAALIEAHYDPAYRRSSRLDERPLMLRLPLGRVDADGFDQAAAELASRLSAS
jgi:tRNA 2-selenouridine synthase